MNKRFVPSALRRRTLLTATGAAILAGAASLPAMAQSNWPTRPLRLVIPLAPGGSADVLARRVAELLAARLGQPVIVDNRPGAGGNVGTDFVAKSAPDGYTLLMTPPVPITQAIALYKKLPYDPQTDFTFVADLAQARVFCAVHPAVPAKSFGELLDFAKGNPGKVSIGSWGNGSQPHMIQAHLDLTYGTQILHVPYKGEAPMIADVLSGQVSMTCGSVTSLKPYLQAGKVRAMATLGPNRAAALQEVPTFAEVGYKDDVFKLTGPYSVLVPSRTPPAIVERLGRELVAIIRNPDMVQQIDSWGMEAVGNGPAEAAAGYKARLPVILKAVRDTGTTMD